MLVVNTVLDRDEKEIGVEILLDGKFFFISADQELWPGIRAGRFPLDNQGWVLVRLEGIMIETQEDDNESPN